MKPCRDCGQPASAMARSCPHCGILNPVQQWVSFPDGSHLHHREPVTAAAGWARPHPFSAAPQHGGTATLAPVPAFGVDATATLPGKMMPAEGGFGQDRLASWAIWAILFQLVSIFFIGGLIGGAIAGVIAYPIGSALPVRADGRKLPQVVSISLIALAIALVALRLWAMRVASGG